MASRSVVLLLSSPEDGALWRTALASQQIVSGPMEAPAGSLSDAMRADSQLGRADALLVDLPALAHQQLTLAKFAHWTQGRWPDLKLVARLPSRAVLSRSEEAWALANGAVALVAGQSVSAKGSSIVPALQTVAHAVGLPEIDASSLDNFLRVMGTNADVPSAAAVGRTHSLLDRLAAEGIDLHDLGRKMQGPGGVIVEDRKYRGKTYRQCFVGSEAIAWVRGKGHLDAMAPDAVAEAMGLTGLVHHVLREHLFSDGNYFFRFGGLPDVLNGLDLDGISRDMRGSRGVAIGTRLYLGKSYENCFVGSEATDWLMDRHHLTVGEAETVGQRLVDLGVLHHVTDERGFIDGPFFYRFVTDDLKH